jgi:hypothetical protein
MSPSLPTLSLSLSLITLCCACGRFEESNAKKKVKNAKITPADVPPDVLANY